MKGFELAFRNISSNDSKLSKQPKAILDEYWVLRLAQLC